MKTLKYLSMALVASLALLTWSCGSGGDEDETPPTPTPTPSPQTGKHFTLTTKVEARASVATVALTGLTSAVTSNSTAPSWFTFTLKPYTAGTTPEVMLAVTENPQTDVREGEVTFIAANDTLVLILHQASFNSSGGTDVDVPFDTPSDQPAFAPER